MDMCQKKFFGWSVLLTLTLLTITFPTRATAQDDQDDPPTRVARLGYMEGSVSFEPAGEDEWVGAVDNRPMTTGDKLWADQNSRAELQLGSAVIRVSQNTGVSFLNLDDNTIQLQLSSGVINIRVRRLDPDNDFEIDTPNLAFTIMQPGSYRLEASEDGSTTMVSIRSGDGQATGNGQTYTLHAGQAGTFSGTDSLNADVEQIGPPDPFETWADGRDRRYDDSRSAHYLSWDVVGYDDLDDHGDWRDDPTYGHVWYPQVDAGWAPYHTGHWDWIDPWGYTWVDDSPWGYAPFHYGRWINAGGRWGWVPGPPAVRAVYAPALVVFIGAGGGWGGNVGWFPLGPREVWVPSYPVSRGYMTQINVSNTTVNTTVITNVYNTTVINRTTNITNISYANRNVQGAVTAVPQNAFASAQPVARVAVRVTPQQIAAAPMTAHVAVAPTPQAVLGARASTAGHVTAPPAAVMSRQVIARKAPPPAPVPFAARQQALAAHPGVPISRQQMATLRPATAAARPMVRVAPAGKPATPTTGHPAPQPNAARPGQPAPNNRPTAAAPAQPNRAPAAQPNRPTEMNRPAAQPNNRPNQPERPETNQPARPETNRPAAQPNNRPAPAEPARPETNRPAAQPNNRPAQPAPARPETNRPAEPPARTERPPAAQPNRQAAPAPRPAAPAAERPQQQRTPPPAAKPAPPKPQPKQTPEEKKREEKPQGM